MRNGAAGDAALLKFTLAAVFVFSAAPLKYLWISGAYFAFSLFFLFFLGADFKSVFRKAAVVMPFALITSFSVIFTSSGWDSFFSVSFKALSSIIMLASLSDYLGAAGFLRALRSLGLPAPIENGIFLMMRYSFFFREMFAKNKMGLDSRIAGRLSPFDKTRIAANFIGIGLVKSFIKSERVYKAMLSRGYGKNN